MSHATSSDVPAIERLLGERAWVARLARSLVADPGSADDLAQETWLAAVEAPALDVERPRAWLATVLRRKVATWRRATGRRLRHESGAARSEAMPSTEELAARAEVTERLAHAVLALDEPYRTTVLHRYVDDAAPRVVAHRMGVPVETVRTRTRRAIALLRARLDPKDEDRRRRLAVAVLALCDGDPALVSISASPWLVTVAMVALGVAAAVGTIGFAGGWWSAPPRPAETADARATSMTDLPSLAAHPSPTPSAATAHEEPDAPPRAPAARWSIEGTVVAGPAGHGVPGASIRLALVRGERTDLLASLRSDGAGRFSADLPALDALSRPGRAVAQLFASVRVQGYTRRGMEVPLATTELHMAPHGMSVTVPVLEGFDARGRVVDERGRPVAAARVAVYSEDGNESIGSDVCDEDGRYEAWIPGPGRGFVTARASQLGTGALEGLTWPGSRDVDLPDLVVAGAGSISGFVKTATGEPVAGIEVWARSLDSAPGGALAHLRLARGNDSGSTRTDRSGRFELTGLRPGRWALRAARWPDRGAVDVVETTTDDRDVALVERGHLLRVRLADEMGTAILGVGIDSTCADVADSAHLTSRSDDDLPCFSAPGGSRVVFSVAQPGCAPIHVVVDAGADGAESTVTLTLKEQLDVGSIVLVPRCETGVTVASAGLSLVSEDTGREVPIDDGFALEPTWSPTDAPIAVAPGRYRLTFSARGRGDDESGSMFIPTTAAFAVGLGKTTRVDLACRRGGRVRFTIEGAPKEGLLVVGGDAVPTSGGDAIELREWGQETDDGFSWGTTLRAEPGHPISPMRALDPGAYRIRLRVKDHATIETTVVIVEERFTEVVARLSAR